jgi:hypothetical protein
VMLLISIVPLIAQVPAVLTKMCQAFITISEPWFTRAIVSAFPLTSAVNAYITLFIIKAYRIKVMNLFNINAVGPAR